MKKKNASHHILHLIYFISLAFQNFYILLLALKYNSSLFLTEVLRHGNSFKKIRLQYRIYARKTTTKKILFPYIKRKCMTKTILLYKYWKSIKKDKPIFNKFIWLTVSNLFFIYFKMKLRNLLCLGQTYTKKNKQSQNQGEFKYLV